MRQAHSRIAVLVTFATVAACAGDMPPPPVVKVTSPDRGMVQSDAGQVVVKGIAQPGDDGSPVVKVTVNNTRATLAPDGSFTAVVDVPEGATLLETIAISEEGGSATDARAVQVGQLRPVDASIERAVTAALSADAFARLATAAGPLIKATNFTALLAPLQPMANVGDSLANAKLSVTKLALGDAKITLTPVDGGLQFALDVDALDLGGKAAYGGTFVPDGTTDVTATADHVTIGGTLVVSPAGTMGFTTKVTSPTIKTTNLQLHASGLAGQIWDLVNGSLGDTIESAITSSAESALAPLINDALGALSGPQSLNVMGKKVDLQASPSEITFSREGALVTMNLQAKIEGSEASPGFIYTPNGTPAMNMTAGIQLGLADDLLNQMLAQVHALGLLDIHLDEDFGLFDTADIKLAVPPMISANTGDGSMRLVLGDMIASFSDHGKPVISAALNAEVDLAIERGNTAQEIALQFGKVHLFVNILGDSGAASGYDLGDAASAGIGLQLDSLSKFLVTVPMPSVAGMTFDNLSLRGDNGYVVVSGQVH